MRERDKRERGHCMRVGVHTVEERERERILISGKNAITKGGNKISHFLTEKTDFMKSKQQTGPYKAFLSSIYLYLFG